MSISPSIAVCSAGLSDYRHHRRNRKPSISPQFADANGTSVAAERGTSVVLDCNVVMLQDYTVRERERAKIGTFFSQNSLGKDEATEILLLQGAQI